MKSYKDYQQMMAHLMRQGYNKGGYVRLKNGGRPVDIARRRIPYTEETFKKIDKLFESIENDFGASKGDLFQRSYLYQILESITWGPHPGKLNSSDTQENDRYGQHIEKMGPVEWGTPEMVQRYADSTPGQNSERILYQTYKYKMQRDVSGEADQFGTVELAQEEGPVAKVKREYSKKYRDLISDRKRDVGGARLDYANKNLNSAKKYSSK